MSLWSSVVTAALGRRPVRFVLTGGCCALVQLALLAALSARGFAPFEANAAAFALAAHLNFAASSTFTWRDRRGGSLPARWLAFLGAVSGTALLNLAVFALASAVLPVVLAAAAGIAVAAVVNYLVADHAIFTRRVAPATSMPALDPQTPSTSSSQYSWRRP